jgi:predicted phosphodiesterase
MKIAIMSDLHLECDSRAFHDRDAKARKAGEFNFYLGPPQPNADILVLAGDIHNGAQAVDWANRSFALPVVLIAGNHEAYGHELFRSIAYSRQIAHAPNMHVAFLERATWMHTSAAGESARFIGTTLWTDFGLHGAPQASMEIAESKLDDFRDIKIERGERVRVLHPSDTIRLHKAAVAFLHRELRQPFNGMTIVVTHYAPSPKSVAAKYKNDSLTPAFASNLEELILAYRPDLWVHGHMHDSFDYVIGRTRIVCNPRGYFPDQLNPTFDPRFVAEVKKR